jgi:hypothetical protein
VDLSCESSIWPILIVPICSHNLENYKEILEIIEFQFEALKPNALILNVATDGDKYRRKIYNSLRRLKPSQIFDDMPLFYNHFLFGKWGINYDWKHLTKRFRGISISKTRSMTLIKHCKFN